MFAYCVLYASFGVAGCLRRCVADDSATANLIQRLRSSGASISDVGVPGQFLSGIHPPSLLVRLDGNWKVDSISELDNPIVRGIEIASDTPLDAKTFHKLGRLKHLKYLSVDLGDDNSDWDIKSISNMRELWSLHLSGRCLDDEVFENLGELQKLETLVVSNADITNESGELIVARFPALRQLSLHQTHVTSPIAKSIPIGIRVLSLRGVKLYEVDCQFLSRMNGLRALDIRDCDVEPSLLETIRGNASIQTLLTGESGETKGKEKVSGTD